MRKLQDTKGFASQQQIKQLWMSSKEHALLIKQDTQHAPSFTCVRDRISANEKQVGVLFVGSTSVIFGLGGPAANEVQVVLCHTYAFVENYLADGASVSYILRRKSNPFAKHKEYRFNYTFDTPEIAKHVVECLDRAFVIYNDESRAYAPARAVAGEELYFDRTLKREQPEFDATLTRCTSSVSEVVEEIKGERFACQLYNDEHIGERHPVLVIINHKGFCVLSATLPFVVYGWHQVFSYGLKEHHFANDAIGFQIEKPDTPGAHKIVFHSATSAEMIVAIENGMKAANVSVEENEKFPKHYAPGAYNNATFHFQDVE